MNDKLDFESVKNYFWLQYCNILKNDRFFDANYYEWHVGKAITSMLIDEASKRSFLGICYLECSTVFGIKVITVYDEQQMFDIKIYKDVTYD